MQRILPHLLAMGSSIGLIAAAFAQDLPGNIASGRHIVEFLVYQVPPNQLR